MHYLEMEDNMNSNQFNKERYERIKNKCRLKVGLQQFRNYPLLNLFWGIWFIAVVLLVFAKRKFISHIDVNPLFTPVFPLCMNVIMILIPVIFAIGIVWEVGNWLAIRDEADLEIVFGDKRDVINQVPILTSKKKDRKSGVVKREFYTTIPMERWQEKKEAICDRMNIHMVGDIAYGGKKRNKGNHIYFESAKGRKPQNRGILYDETF
mgnify:CR=1 FL=1